ncbi:MAG: phospho-sugar mutase [Actinomycetota bacterium]
MSTPPPADLWARARRWLAEDPDPLTRAELADLLDAGDVPAVADRFAGPLQFGTAGLRGELGAGPNRMNRAVVIRATAGLAGYLRAAGCRRVVVGYDARHRSADFAADAVAVLDGAGLEVLRLPRPLPTPVLVFALGRLAADAGVMITASHNPPRDNGYKVYLHGRPLAPPADAEIAARIAAVGPLAEVPRGSGGTTAGEEVVHDYLDALARLPAVPDREVSVAYTPLHGVGGEVLTAAFDRLGFPPPVVVPEQAAPDPDFPTVPFPNPEEPGAMDLVLATAQAHGTDLALANDPDADRCAVAVGGRVLRGDEVGCLLADHLLTHSTGGDRLVVTTVVSSSLLERIAAAHGVAYRRTLVGFKWILQAATDSPGRRLVLGYEEALGYCVGGPAGQPVVRDKDGIAAAVTVAALAAALRREGRTLLDALDDLARRYGVHHTDQLSLRLPDRAQIAAAVARFTQEPPTTLGGLPVREVADLAAGWAGLPPTPGVRLALSDGWVVVRPSGTEPKLKCYLEVVAPVAPGEAVAAARARAAAVAAGIRADLHRHATA